MAMMTTFVGGRSPIQPQLDATASASTTPIDLIA
jgi:hypothetical protein